MVPWVEGVLAIGVAGLFLARREGAGRVGLALLVALTLGITLLDYRLRLNQHLMQTLSVLAFVALPDQRRVGRALVLSYYFWAGTLKLGSDWLTGAALARTGVPGVPEDLLPAACAYVAALELVGVWGLLGPRWLRWLTLGQLLTFHALSYGVVGAYYPALMICLLAIFPLSDAMPEPAPSPPSRAPLAVALAFGAAQLLGWAAPGDPALTSQGRVWTLHMFDAHVLCEAEMTVTAHDGATHRVPIPTDRGPDRMRCDPIVHWGVARHTCGQEGVREVHLRLRSRRSTQADLLTIIDHPRFCAEKPSFSLWSNDWILGAQSEL